MIVATLVRKISLNNPSMTERRIDLSHERLTDLLRQKYGEISSVGWRPTLRLNWGYFLPSDFYEALDEQLVTESRLACHLCNYKSDFTKHLHDRQIPPAKNYAKQTLRTAVLLRKVACCNRSERELRRSKT
jgi:hypothetical protein